MREFESARLSFAPHRRADFEDSVLLWSDPLVTRFTVGRPQTREEVWARLLRYVGHWEVLGYGYWAVRERASGRFVGEVGFAHFMRDVVPSLGDAPEAGWVLLPWSHGQGLATEAVVATHEWLNRARGALRTVCMISPENAASLRVAAKCGYQEWTRSTYKAEPTILFER